MSQPQITKPMPRLDIPAGKGTSIPEAILAALPGLFFLLDRQGQFLRVNKALERLAGTDSGHLLQSSALCIFDPEDRLRIADCFDAAFDTGYAEVEARLGGRDGRRREVFFACTRMVFEGCQILVCTGLDITKRKLTQELLARNNDDLDRRVKERTAELLESNERLKKVLEVETVGVMFWDLTTGAMVDANDTFLNVMGYSRRELEAGELTWQKLTPPEFYEVSLQEVEKFMRTGRVGPYEKEYLRKDGSRQWFVFAGSALGKNSCVEFCVDISARKQAEQQLRLQCDALQAAGNAIVICDRDGTIRWVNNAFTTLTGYTDREIVGQNPRVLNSGKQNADFYQALWETILGGKVWRGELVNKRKDNTLYDEEMSITPVKAATGEITHFIAIKQDITQEKETQMRLQRSQRLESLGTLAGGIAHDMNNMLAPIMMSMELLRAEYPGESGLLDTVQTSARRAAEMVRQLLSFAKGAEGEHVSIQVAHLVKEMQGIIATTFPKNIELEVRLERDLPAVLGDATQLHQVLLNLCVNARDAMPQGGRLTLEASTRDVDSVYAASVVNGKPGRYVVARVLDTGTGIAPDVLERIFEPFFTTKGPEKGTGLGLANVIGIVKGHGGFIQVYTEPGKGSAFAVYLPIETDGDGPCAIDTSEVNFRAQGQTILLVDDEVAVRDTGRAVLRQLNFNPLTASDGAEGVVVAAEHRAELSAALVDMQMPHMDGLALVRALRRMQPELPIVAMSGRFEDSTLQELEELGVTLHLPKPFTEHQLVTQLLTIFERERGDGSTAERENAS